MITLAVITGIPVSEWASEGARSIATAFEVWTEIERARKGVVVSEQDGGGSGQDGGGTKPMYSG